METASRHGGAAVSRCGHRFLDVDTASMRFLDVETPGGEWGF